METEADGPSEKPQNEIDAIFAGKPRKKKKKQQQQEQLKERDVSVASVENAISKKRKRKKKKKTGGSDEALASSGPRKKTEEGFHLYTEAELGLNQKDAGATPLCPFGSSNYTIAEWKRMPCCLRLNFAGSKNKCKTLQTRKC